MTATAVGASADNNSSSTNNAREDWLDLLRTSRLQREQSKAGHQQQAVWKDFVVRFQPHFGALTQQIDQYINSFYLSRGDADAPAENNDTTKDSSKTRRIVCLATRNALRFGLSCLSVEDDETRQWVQEELVEQWHSHESLCRLLMLSKAAQKSTSITSSAAHAQIRLLAARLLCNLVTQNPTTSFHLLSAVSAQPHQDVIEARLVAEFQDQCTDDQDDDDNNNNNHGEEEYASKCRNDASQPIDLNWLDMLVGNTTTPTTSRETLAAVVATIYNALMPLDSNTVKSQEPTSHNNPKTYDFIRPLAQSGLFVSTLLRQIVSSQACRNILVGNTKEGVGGAERKEDNDDHVDNDDATLWITNLFMLFLRHDGCFSEAYSSIGSLHGILPEQVALLYCVRGELERTVQDHGASSTSVLFAQPDAALDCMVFLARVYSNVRTVIAQNHVVKEKEEKVNNRQQPPPPTIIGKATWLAILDIVGSYLGVDDATTARIRVHLGTHTCMMQELAMDLAQVYDSVAGACHGTNSRAVSLSQDEQAALIGLVRVIGNMSFQCRCIQDIVRTTKAPRHDDIDRKSCNRSALHLVLSTTSLSHTCFSLREWCLVAIRYLVENNDANQQVLVELEAQQPVQSPELQSMGVRVALNPNGNVQLKPFSDVDGNANDMSRTRDANG
ncbi:hypothetical protein ACA910_016837 [Epithemia clementina (nom. ined.)]